MESKSELGDLAGGSNQSCAPKTKAELEERLGELEMSLHGEETDDDTRADILDEIAEIEEELESREAA